MWQGRFKAFPIQEDDQLRVVIRYIERDPLRAALVARVEQWPWSSLARGAETPVLDPGPALRGLGRGGERGDDRGRGDPGIDPPRSSPGLEVLGPPDRGGVGSEIESSGLGPTATGGISGARGTVLCLPNLREI